MKGEKMQENVIKTHLAHGIEKTEYEAQYDENVKLLLSDKQVLARIVKYRTEEFENYDIPEIIECIEGEPEVSSVSVIPGKSRKETIIGMNNESKEAYEGEVTFDVRFYMLTKKEKRIKIILNIEAQKNYYPGYHFEPRAVFYCARMISEQLDREFSTENYNELKKVYSIWICMYPPKYCENTIIRYRMDQQVLFGKVKGNKEFRYDLMEVLIVNLPRNVPDETAEPNLNGMLKTLFSPELSKEEIEGMFEERKTEQKTEHNGGSYWIGTNGTSTFGHNGKQPGGIRIGGQSALKSAFQVVGDRRFADFRNDKALNIRQFQVAFRRLRQFSSKIEAPKTELDLDGTIDSTCNNGGYLKLEFEKPRKNTVKLLLLFDSGGTMMPFSTLCNNLFQAVHKANHFKDVKTYYFHNCIY